MEQIKEMCITDKLAELSNGNLYYRVYLKSPGKKVPMPVGEVSPPGTLDQYGTSVMISTSFFNYLKFSE